MSLTPGTRLGVYEVVVHIGDGGMGRVFRARDTKLNRDVALKILPDAVGGDAERLARLMREAQTLAALNHPNIAHIHGFEESPATSSGQAPISALVMEFVDGEDLSQRLARGQLPLDEARALARQIAEALEAAHEHGIVHRDLKPANIKVRPDGTVKVLDFGLAKAMESVGGSSLNVSQSPTYATPAATQAGVIMGTAGYMSPEQARGRPVDRRADIWAFGCVLYEMLTGRAAFARDTVTDTLSAITRDEPDWSAHPEIPPDVNRLLRRCLDKDPRTRLRDIGEARIALDRGDINERARTDTTLPAPKGRRAIAALTLVALLLLATNAITWWFSSRSVSPSPPSFGPVITRVTADSGLTTQPAVAANGSLLAYASDRGGSNMNIWVQPLPEGQPVQITHGNEDAVEPHFSPDGSRIVFRSERDGGGLYVVPALGGAERFIAAKGRQPRFSPDGKSIAYLVGGRGATAELWIVDEGGSSPRRVVADVRDQAIPVWSPDGAFIVAPAIRGEATPVRDWWLVNAQSGAESAMSAIPAFERNGLSFTGLPAAWVNNEILFAATNGDVTGVWAISVSPDGRTVIGSPRRVTAGIGVDTMPTVVPRADGLTMYYAHQDVSANVFRLPLAGEPSVERLERLTDAAATEIWPSVSSDGRTLVFASNRSSALAVWSRDLANGRDTPLTSAGARVALISSDGRRIAYEIAEQSRVRLVTRPIGGGTADALPDGLNYLWSWPSPNVMFGSSASGPTTELRVVDPVAGNMRPVLVTTAPSGAASKKPGELFYGHAQLSPDGRWASAMEWLSADQARIILFPFRDTPVPSSEWTALTGDQTVEEEHAWSPQGDAIYFVSEKDGNRCIWMRKLDPAGARPVGAVTSVLHLHGARRSMISTAARPQRIALAANSLFFSVQEQRGNIWRATFRAK